MQGMYNIAVVGDRESVAGFKAAGFTPCVVRDPAETAEAVRNLAKEGYAIIFVTENMIDKNTKVFDEFRNTAIPAIIPIPGNRGTAGIGLQEVKKAVERAVGADILKEE